MKDKKFAILLVLIISILTIFTAFTVIKPTFTITEEDPSRVLNRPQITPNATCIITHNKEGNEADMIVIPNREEVTEFPDGTKYYPHPRPNEADLVVPNSPDKQ